MQDKTGQPLYRRVIDNPLRQDLEVVTEDAERSVARVAAEAGGTFFLIVPDIPQASKLILKTAPALTAARSAETAGAPPEAEVHEFDLTSTGQEGR